MIIGLVVDLLTAEIVESLVLFAFGVDCMGFRCRYIGKLFRFILTECISHRAATVI